MAASGSWYCQKAASLYKNEARLRGTSAASPTTLKHLLPGIKDECDALIAWTNDLIKAECSAEINEAISNTIIDSAPVPTDLHEIFTDVMGKRIVQLQEALSAISISEAFSDFDVKKTFTANGLLSLTLCTYQSHDKIVAILNFEPTMNNNHFESAILLYANWNDVAAFCAKVYAQLAKK